MNRLSASFEFKLADRETAPGTFEGYASVFGNEDDCGDVVLPGAFKDTLAVAKSSGRMPKMLLNHGGLGGMLDPDPQDLLPIGKWEEMSEDTKGLSVRGRLINLDTDVGKRIYGAMKEGELDSMSIAYIARDFVRGTKANEPRRQLKRVDLIEAGPVTFPANQLAAITAVKGARADQVQTAREFEDLLQNAGFSRTAAKKLAAGGWAALKSDDGAEEAEVAALVQRLNEAATQLKGGLSWT